MIRACAYQGIKNVSFLKNFTNMLNEWSQVKSVFSVLWFSLSITFFSSSDQKLIKPTIPVDGNEMIKH